MPQIGVLNGVYTDQVAGFRTSYPRNLMPVPKETGIAQGYLQPADGIELFGTGPGVDRGGINWQGNCYRVMGSSLVRVAADGSVTILGDVGAGGQVTMDSGFDRLAIWSGGRLYYWDSVTLQVVTDIDLGTVIDGRWINGYFMSTDGEFLIVTELNDPFAVNPLKYGSAEADPDGILAVDELRSEAYALGRYTIEVFQNVGGSGFPFQRIESARVVRGIVGTHAYSRLAGSFAFVGSGRNEAPAVYLMVPGDTLKISTSEIDKILKDYNEIQLSTLVVETRLDEGHELLLVHMPDRTWVYDVAASKVVGEPVWFELTSSIVGPGRYRARNLVWCYDSWLVGDPTSPNLGRMVKDVSTHYGQPVGWEFGTTILYNESRGAIIHELELVALTGRVAAGADPVVWTSYSLDGQTWSVERPTAAGRQGERTKRIVWRRQGKMQQYRIQKFRGTSDARITIARLEAQMEALSA